jgi:hypothetical protein
MHPVEIYEAFRRAWTVQKAVEIGTAYQVALTPEQETFHLLQSGQDVLDLTNIYFDSVALGYFPRTLTKYERKELYRDAPYFETMFVVEMNHQKQAIPPSYDNDLADRAELLQQNPSHFMWMFKYWNQQAFEYWREAYEDGIWQDDSNTDYDIILFRHDDPTILALIAQFQGEKK